MKNLTAVNVTAGLVFALTASTTLAQTAPPPTLGQETKGQPAIEEDASEETSTEALTTQEAPDEAQKSSGPLGSATIKESRRESGQVYMIELKHSAGAPQYIEEHDSDGNIESEATDIEETPNLAKWRLGTW
jgi:hypothetical protein